MNEGDEDRNLERYLEEHPDFVRRWLVENGDSKLLSTLLEKHQQRSSLNNGCSDDEASEEHPPIRSMPRSKRNSVTSDLFQMLITSPQRKSSSAKSISMCGEINNCVSALSKRNLATLDENELFMELIRDVANELDINVLCHKILVNVELLTHADRGSLFLARGPREARYLVAKLFDVTVETELEEAVKRVQSEEIRIPFGLGIAGSVAHSKEVINIKNAYEDSRFNAEIDMKTGYKTDVILCLPICNYEGEVIGVAQIINKTDGSKEFSQRDVEVFRRYLTFCGIGIQNAQLFEMSVLEYRRNQILLNLARSIFEEQNNLQCLVSKIMKEARDLLKCERCNVFLKDLPDCSEPSHFENVLMGPRISEEQEPSQPLFRRESKNLSIEDVYQQKCIQFHTVFELKLNEDVGSVHRPSLLELSKSTLAQIAKYVAATNEILNIGDVSSWMKQEVKEEDGFVTRSILCMPIVNGQKSVIGVAQLINKTNGTPFTDCDVSIFEAFAIFCGLGIHNTQMYENACKLMAKQKVALECLSYHAAASREDTEKLNKEEIPSAETFNLYSFTFIDFNLEEHDTCRACMRMFMELNLINRFHIPYHVLCRWVLSVKKNYRPVKYHNWRHALNVGQTMFAMLKTGRMEQFMKDLEIFGLLVACLCHDLDHRGTNNSFQTKTESPLAILYTTSTMEHHHFDQCVMILNSEGNNIFQALSTEDYREVMKVVETAILSTDLAMYFKKRSSFLELVENGEFDWQSEEKKEVLCGMMMTACDVSAIAKPWEIQHKMAKLVADEFFDQGDLEKLKLNQQPIAMMDRERKDELPQMQVGFIDVICKPLYKVLSDTFPWMLPLYEGCMENRKNWQDLAEKVEMGLTWIDHDTIDKPVEEFTKTCEPEDIEFTVTTLHQEKKQFSEHPGRLTRLSRRNGGHRFSSLRHYTFKSKDKSFDKGVSAKTSPPTPTKELSSPEFETGLEKTIKEPGPKTPDALPTFDPKPPSEADEGPLLTVMHKKKKKKCIIM
ncbi:cGMP-specific 3',5'-cyclic phosphodiesterase [Neocloeon triangulifer]|uniref:cGMP-specific 3',5'-cyclic phosphodiesterase n=1 Tax=Neocloeon triangulifer TaxID=2078957 RepID=UPI00286F16A1|nr:cGMP-specific 3',5'-cyclic phosphodiesterase [Neocloeon triangulifer]